MNKDRSKKTRALKLLEGAYNLKTPDDNISYYKNFSGYYDEVFATALNYNYPKGIANEFLKNYDNEGLICDIGCGTGLVTQELKNLNNDLLIDGFDISPEMIKVAKDKKIYRNLYEIDLTKPIDNVPNNYSGIISAGVFTHGHLGPEVIKKLLSICLDGAILTIGINAAYYENKKFEDFIINLESSAEIKEINKIKIPIYADSNNLEKKVNNMAIICSFIKN